MTLSINGLSVEKNGAAHLHDINAQFERGKLTTVIGRTLAGKTTLLRSIAGLQTIDAGQIKLDGKPFSNLPPWQRDVALVYQQFINYPHLTVYDNVAFPLKRKGLAKSEISKRTASVLETVGLSAFHDRRPSALSGGQQQRVALARALVRQSSILLLDEPLVNLDYKLREQLREDFRALLTTQKDTAVIYNTTEPAEALMLGDWLVVMHEGRIVQAGIPADVFERPASAIVAGVINDPPMNLLRGTLGQSGITLEGGVKLASAPHLSNLPLGPYLFGIRANELYLGEEGTKASITFSEVSGSETFMHATLPFADVVVQVEGVHNAPIGSQVNVIVPSQKLYCFATEGDGALVAAPHRGNR